MPKLSLDEKLYDLDTFGDTREHTALIKLGANVNHVDDANGQTLIFVAASYGNEALVKLLVLNGAKVNVVDNHGYTPLHSAACNDRANICDFLISRGAWINFKDKRGYTPLYLAAVEGRTQACLSLLEAGANTEGLGSIVDEQNYAKYNPQCEIALASWLKRESALRTIDESPGVQKAQKACQI